MKNLAGDPLADDAIREELSTAGIPIFPREKGDLGEVPYSIIGRLKGWEFRRAWYFYDARCVEGCEGVCEVSYKDAVRLNELYRHQLRVNGSIGGDHPRRGGVISYHIDYCWALRIFADFLRERRAL